MNGPGPETHSRGRFAPEVVFNGANERAFAVNQFPLLFADNKQMLGLEHDSVANWRQRGFRFGAPS
jgi:hypothetical protein